MVATTQPVCPQIRTGTVKGEPFRYVRIPDKLLRDALYAPRCIGVYALIARLWLVAQAPVPLSAADLVLLDPSLSRGSAQRALAWLIARHWIVVVRHDGEKSTLLPSWGSIDGAPRRWTRADSRYGRPPHIHTSILNLDLLDVYLGRLVPFDGQRPARVTRYLRDAMLTLADVGRYVLERSGYGSGVPAPALVRLGLIVHGQTQPLEDARSILTNLAQTTPLSDAGQRYLEHANQPPNPGTSVAPPFFVPPNLIGNPSTNVIGHLIDPLASSSLGNTASQCVIPPAAHDLLDTNSIPWDIQESQEHDPTGTAVDFGGGQQIPNGRSASTPLPATPSARALNVIGVAPTTIRELAHIADDVVRHTISCAQHDPNVRHVPNFVVWALRRFLENGFQLNRGRGTHIPSPPTWSDLVAQSTDGFYRLGDDLDDVEALDSVAPGLAETTNDDHHVDDSVVAVDDGGAEALPCPADAPADPPDPPDPARSSHVFRPCDVTSEMVARLQQHASPAQWQELGPLLIGVSACYDGHTLRLEGCTSRAWHAIATTYAAVFQHMLATWPSAAPPRFLIACSDRGQVVPLPADADFPPPWIDPALWFDLPPLLRSALRSAHLVNGTVHWSQASLGRWIEARYATALAQVLQGVAAPQKNSYT